MEPASQHQDPRLTAQPPTAFSGRARGSLAVLPLVSVWVLAVSLMLGFTSHPEGTDSSRFSAELTSLREEIFFWHESMYIFGAGAWVPDIAWREDIEQQVADFMTEMNRLPDSPCANKARTIIAEQGLFMAVTLAAMPAVEYAWKNTIDKLPLDCGEF